MTNPFFKTVRIDFDSLEQRTAPAPNFGELARKRQLLRQKYRPQLEHLEDRTTPAVDYKYIPDFLSYTGAVGSQVTASLFLDETVTGASRSVIFADGGLFGAGVLVTQTNAGNGAIFGSGGNFRITPNGNPSPIGFGGLSNGGTTSTPPTYVEQLPANAQQSGLIVKADIAGAGSPPGSASGPKFASGGPGVRRIFLGTLNFTVGSIATTYQITPYGGSKNTITQAGTDLDFGTQAANGYTGASNPFGGLFAFTVGAATVPAVVSISSPSVTESGALAFLVTISNPVDVAVTANLATSDGTATTADNDYTALASNNETLFAPGSTTPFTINVSTTGDSKVEANETLSMILSNLAAGGRAVTFSGGGATLTGAGTITNDDSATVTLSSVSATKVEGTGGTTTAFTFQATLSAAVAGGVTVAYTTNDGTATVADGDYVDNDGSLTFTGTAGETKTITVLVNQDNKVEANETFTMVLGAISGLAAGVPGGSGTVTAAGSPQTGTITNDDSTTVSQPRILSVTPNGNLPAFAGAQSSRVINITVVFNQAVELDADAITLALHTGNVRFGGVLQPSGFGTLPTALVLNTTENITWTVTFSGNTDTGIDGFASLKDGVYDLNIDATKVHPSGTPSINMGADSTTAFHRLFGDTNAPAAPSGGTAGVDFEATVNTGDNFIFRGAFNNAAGYKPYLDFNGDSTINSGDNLQFRNRFNKALAWRV